MAGVVHDRKPHNDEEEIPRGRSNFDGNSVDDRLAAVSQAIAVEPDRMTKVEESLIIVYCIFSHAPTVEPWLPVSMYTVHQKFMQLAPLVSTPKIVGVMTLNIVRANKFASSLADSSVRDAWIPVIGKHADITIFPTFSQCPVGQRVLARAVTWFSSCVL